MLCKTEIKFSPKFINLQLHKYVKNNVQKSIPTNYKSIHHSPEYSNLLRNICCNITSIVYHAPRIRKRKKKKKTA